MSAALSSPDPAYTPSPLTNNQARVLLYIMSAREDARPGFVSVTSLVRAGVLSATDTTMLPTLKQAGYVQIDTATRSVAIMPDGRTAAIHWRDD